MTRFHSYIFFLVLSVGGLAQNNPSPFINTNLTRGTELRVLRLAISLTGEFTQSLKGGSDEEKIQEGLRELRSFTKEMNDIFGREYCVHFELIPDQLERKIIFLDPSTDPWPDMQGTGCDGSKKIFDLQGKAIDELIGVGNYEISLVAISPKYNGGCGGWFKGGYSGGINYTVCRHEMGHEFQQAHTINWQVNNNY